MRMRGAKHHERGQYMVEFGMTFIFFIFIVLAVINLMLVAYNFNLGQRAGWEAARLAARGGSNASVADVVYTQFVSQFFASPFLQSAIIFDKNTFITPNNEFDRVQGKEITVFMGYRVGVSFLAMSNFQATFPITTRLIVIQRNDQDRDNLYDTTTVNAKADSLTNNHDNDSYNDITTDTDDDNDGRMDIVDTGIITWNGFAYNLDTGMGPRLCPILDDGTFHAPVLMTTVTQTGAVRWDTSPIALRPQTIPRSRVGFVPLPSIYVDLSKDRNNNGWEDKYD
jgi:hypothetical protein